MNCHGQTKLEVPKQLYIQNYLLTNNIDVLMCQETRIDDQTFEQCNFIRSNYNIIKNNAANSYGTSVLVHVKLSLGDVKYDTDGRIIIFNIDDITFCNVYPKAGTDSESKQEREDLLNLTLPNMLHHHKVNLIIGGDWNCITENHECTDFPDQKRSPTLKRLLNLYNLKDTYKHIYPRGREFSRYYANKGNQVNATRIDRIYFSKHLSPTQAKYIPNPFSDHYSYITNIQTSDLSQKSFVPKPKPSFKIHPNIVDDPDFQFELKSKLEKWRENKKKFNYDTINWWEVVIKPGIKNLAVIFTKKRNESKYGKLNMLYLKQKYFQNKIEEGKKEHLADLKLINFEIKEWFIEEAKATILLINAREVEENETLNLYQHDLHKKKIKRAAISTLATPNGLINGHKNVQISLLKKFQIY